MNHSPPHRLSDEQALQWVSRLAAEPDNQALDEARLPDAERQRLHAWLAQAPEHADAYASARQLWQVSGTAAAQLAGEDDAALQAILRGEHARRRKLPIPLAVAASLLLAGLLTLVGRPERWLDDLQADYRSAPGQLQALTLADGSEVLLDGDSAIDVTLNADSREVRLRRGAAWFHVQHNGQPFVVHADGGEVRVLGTRFEVRREARTTRVTVEDGRVAVQPDTDAATQVLNAAQRIEYQQGLLGPLQRITVQEAFGWREGRLSFRREPLADALAVVQRSYPGRIVLLNAELGQRPVSGDFASNDPQAILSAFQAVLGYSQQVLPGGTLLIR